MKATKTVEIEVCDRCRKEDNWALFTCDICEAKVCRYCRYTIQGVGYIVYHICRTHLPPLLVREKEGR